MGSIPLSDHSQVLGDVVVVVGNHHQPFGWIVVLEDAEVGREDAHHRVGELDGLHPKERVEDAMRLIELNESAVRQDAAHLRLEVVPLLLLEVVEDREPPLH